VQHANHSHIISIRWIEVDVGQFPATRLLNLGFFQSTPKTPSPTPHGALFPRVDPRPRVVQPLARFRPDSQKRRLGRLVVDNFFLKKETISSTLLSITRGSCGSDLSFRNLHRVIGLTRAIHMMKSKGGSISVVSCSANSVGPTNNFIIC
jgi:hypothetical protein